MILHLSDLHFGTERPECLKAIQQFCQSHPLEAVVVSGDLTQRARFGQFFDCKKFLDQLNTPYMVIPGNHDIPLYHLWNRFFNPFTRYQIFFGELEPVFETENFYLIGVNSIRRRYHTKGHLSLEQIQRIDMKLAQAPVSKLKIIVSHQPFYVPSQNKRGFKDSPLMAKIALQAWAEHGLFGVLHGHLHQPATYDLNQIFKLGLDHPVYDVHAGTSASNRLHQNEPNSFNLIDATGNISQYLFDEMAQSFVFKADLSKK
ncbi:MULTISPECIES: metallophosphoesterase family protein [unclassified Acinetobacter]|uniref:metallophosphoesterase family protein n=1 Tax=unclassified Acinetobacter TaxID=196816 RepID=UPI0007D0A7C5|nr:metallophosphoesterase [Acinetobacter sp. SFA]OAL82970.1 3',5'-cyclic-nucleotide phosphodiesterase [Acinetobacter sp. SFA]